MAAILLKYISIFVTVTKETESQKQNGGIIMRVQVILECTETGDRNYITTKNKQKNPERLELMKYCPRLKKHTLHRETK